MDFSKISYTQVSDNAANLRSASSEMAQILASIKTQFNKIGSDDVWSGSAASETKAKFDQLSAKFEDFSTSVNDCANYLEQVVANFQAVENKISGQ